MSFLRRLFVVVGIVLASILAIYFNVILMRAFEFDRWTNASAQRELSSHADTPAPSGQPAETPLHTSRKSFADFKRCLEIRVRSDLDPSLRRSGLAVELSVHPSSGALPTQATVTTSSGNADFDQIVQTAAVQCIEPFAHDLAGRSIPVKYLLP